jgi:hypothetical protein
MRLSWRAVAHRAVACRGVLMLPWPDAPEIGSAHHVIKIKIVSRDKLCS